VRSGNERQGRNERRRGCGVPDRRSASVAAGAGTKARTLAEAPGREDNRERVSLAHLLG
jgi:hypothetical protein